MKIRQIPLAESLAINAPLSALAATQQGEITYSKDRGYHIYGELRLGLRITAAEDERAARQYLHVLERYALATEIAALIDGAHLLEMQGERVHLFLPAPQDDKAAVDRVLRFSVAVNDLVYSQIAPMAGAAFRGFALAACHGQTVFLRHGQGPAMSIISLSPAANEPAKRLGKDNSGKVHVEAKHLSIPSESFKRAGYPATSSGKWENVPLDPLPQSYTIARDRAFLDRLTETLTRELAQVQDRGDFQFRDAKDTLYAETVAILPGQAVRVSGYMLRADLAGFTRQVSSAFDQGEAGVTKLVERFVSILRHAEQFKSEVAAPKYMRLPWAGDCANLGILPPIGKLYVDTREFIPCDVPAEWHSHWKDSSARALLDSILNKATWAVACAGGDEDNNGHAPAILFAVLRGRNREYLVAAGWSVGRSLDALEADDVTGDTTVIPHEDWSALASQRQKLFKKLNSWLYISLKRPDYDDIKRGLIEGAREPSQISIAGTPAIIIPGAKPHFNEYN